MQHRKVKSIGILVHSDDTQFYICSADEKVHSLIIVDSYGRKNNFSIEPIRIYALYTISYKRVSRYIALVYNN